jgi:hypothetical protein
VNHFAAVVATVLWVGKESVVTPPGERIALVVLLVACVLAEQAAVDTPILTARAAAQTDLIVELERVDDRGRSMNVMNRRLVTSSSEFGVLY